MDLVLFCALAVGVTGSADTPCKFPLLKSGSRVGEVNTLQYLLNQLDYKVAVDGIFGSGTLSAVKAFQTKQGLTVDGEVGALGWGTLVAMQMAFQPSTTAPPLIMAVQWNLMSKYNYSLSLTGILDTATKSALTEFKQRRGSVEEGHNSPLFWLTLLRSECVVPPAARYGLDLSVYQGNVSQASWNCLAAAGFSSAIIQAQRSSTAWNEYAPNDVANAHKAGIDDVAVYFFLDFDKAASQVSDTISLLKKYEVNVTRIWFDIEGSKTTPIAQNQQFLHDTADLVQTAGYELALYVSKNTWTRVFGDLTGYGHLRQWYAHYDGVPAFYDFVPFADFALPFQKQFLGTTDMCGTQLDLDFQQA